MTGDVEPPDFMRTQIIDEACIVVYGNWMMPCRRAKAHSVYGRTEPQGRANS